MLALKRTPCRNNGLAHNGEQDDPRGDDMYSHDPAVLDATMAPTCPRYLAMTLTRDEHLDERGKRVRNASAQNAFQKRPPPIYSARPASSITLPHQCSR